MKHHHTEHVEGVTGRKTHVRDVVDAVVANIRDQIYRTVEDYAAFYGVSADVENTKRVRVSVTVQEIGHTNANEGECTCIDPSISEVDCPAHEGDRGV